MNINKHFDTILQQKLDERNTSGLLRNLTIKEDEIDLSSNDYLGFATLQLLKNNNETSIPSGATGSRLVTGNSALAEETEKIIANFHNAEAALIFNAGYMANVGLFSCIASKGDTIITDEFIHASIIDGARLSYANRFKFKHNDIVDLEKKLQQAKGQIFVAVESIYSMDGDEAPLIAISNLCTQYHALLIVDEAHAIGVYGNKGEGLVCKYNLQKEVYATIYTFGKALGLHGSAIVGSCVLQSYLINNARTFIYATALPPHTYYQIQQAYQLLPTADRNTLFQLIHYFQQCIKKTKDFQFINSQSPIQGIIIGDNFKAKNLANQLIEKDFFVKAILSPTIAVGSERLRICLHSFNTEKQVTDFFNLLNSFNFS